MTDLGPLDRYPEGRVELVDVGRLRVGILRWQGNVYAIHNRCPHQAGPLCLGRVGPLLTATVPGDFQVEPSTVILACPWHGWEFDVSTGEAIVDPEYRMKVWPASVQDGRVLIDLKGTVARSGRKPTTETTGSRL